MSIIRIVIGRVTTYGYDYDDDGDDGGDDEIFSVKLVKFVFRN